MTTRERGEFIDVTDKVNLTVKFKDQYGNPINTDSFPTISIIQPSGLVLISPTSAGVQQLGVGHYSFVFTAPYNGPYGVFKDVWVGYVNGFRLETDFLFVVAHTQMPAIKTDEKPHLGDDPGFHYSECAIKNINKIMKSLKSRLNSSGKSKSADAYGNVVYADCDIFTIANLTTFIATALSDFNQVPYTTFFNFDEDYFVDQYLEILVEGATLYALCSQDLLERGREFSLTDNGLNFQMPTVSELMHSQYTALSTAYYDKLKYIKNSLRPHPKGLGVFGMTSSLNPAIRNQRHLRARRIF